MKKFSFALTNAFVFMAAYAGFYQDVESAKNIVIGLCWLSFIVTWIISGSKDEKPKLDYAEKCTLPMAVYIAADVVMLAILIANSCWFTALAVLFHINLFNDIQQQAKKITADKIKADKQSGLITF